MVGRDMYPKSSIMIIPHSSYNSNVVESKVNATLLRIPVELSW